MMEKIVELVPNHQQHWVDDLGLLAERLREEPVEYYKEAANWLDAFNTYIKGEQE